MFPFFFMERLCKKCDTQKPMSEFYVARRDKLPLASAYNYECKSCVKKRVRAKHLENPDRTKNNDLKRMYGITLEEHNKMFDEQNGACYLCHKPGDGRWKKLCVDHDHKTGKVRKLLCRSCNTALGQVGDNIDLLERMVTYLKEN